MNKILSIFLTPLFYIVFGLILLVFQPIQVVTRVVFGAKAHDVTVGWLNFCLTAALMLLGTRIKFKNFRTLDPDKPVLIVSNHQSMWDISPIIWKLRAKRTKYIAKASLARYIPSISYNLKYGGSLSIDRSDHEGSLLKIKAFAQFIDKNKFAIVIYPEGSRSRDGLPKQFKSGGIEAILRVIPDINVVPIAIKDTSKIDNNGKFLKRIGVHISFDMLPDRKLDIQNLERDLELIRQEIKEKITT